MIGQMKIFTTVDINNQTFQNCQRNKIGDEVQGEVAKIYPSGALIKQME